MGGVPPRIRPLFVSFVLVFAESSFLTEVSEHSRHKLASKDFEQGRHDLTSKVAEHGRHNLTSKPKGVIVEPEFGLPRGHPKDGPSSEVRSPEVVHKPQPPVSESPQHKRPAKPHVKPHVAPEPPKQVESLEAGHQKAEAPAEKKGEHKHGMAHIRHFEGEEGELEEEALAEYVVVPIGVAIIVALFLGGTLERLGLTWLPESAATIIVGVILGFYMKSQIGYHAMFTNEDVFNKTCSTLLTLFLLPILIFESGWSLRAKDFASQFEYVMLFAIVGSLISFMVVGSLIYWTGESHLGIHSIGFPRTAFAYASLIAATDPVATLATYSKLKVDPLLNIMVWGDSTFNDAVAIVLFKVLNNDDIMGKPGSRPGMLKLSNHILGGILKIFLGSLGIGLLVGTAFLLVLRFLHMRHAPRLEILGLVAMGYVSFAIAEVVGMSGIIACMFCSILLGFYARPHLSRNGSMLATFFLKEVACLMDTSVFLLTGFCVVQLGPQGYWFAIWAMLFCLIARAAAVFPVGFLVNALKRKMGRANGVPVDELNLLSNKALFMMWHAGLRGAISLTLCMQLGEWVDILDGENTRHILQTATYCLILVFLLVFGGSTEACLLKCGIPVGQESDPNKLYQSEAPGTLKNLVDSIDEKILTPLFIGEERLDRVMEEKDIEEVLDSETPTVKMDIVKRTSVPFM